MVFVRQVIEDDKQWWKLRNRSGQAGYVPFNILDVVTVDEADGIYSHVRCRTRPPSVRVASPKSVCTQQIERLL